MNRVRSLFAHVVLLTATSLLMRTIGISFTVYLSSRIGSLGIGVYQLIASVYGLMVTLAISGIRFAATRLVAEESGLHRQGGVRRAMAWCTGYALFFGLLSGCLLFTFAEPISLIWLKDSRTYGALRVLAFSLPFVAVSAAINGYFNALRKLARCALIQGMEQTVRILSTIVLLGVLLPQGLAFGCIAIAAGECISELFACFLLTINYLWDSRRHQRKNNTSGSHLGRRMLSISLPIAGGSYARSALSTLQHLLIPRGLQQSGASSSQALMAYGAVHGMVLPLVLYPSAMVSVLGDLLLPELTESQVRGHVRHIRYIVTRVLKLGLIFSVGVMGTLFRYGPQWGDVIYQDASLGFYIRIFAPLVLIMYMDILVDGMLKGLGQQFASMGYNVVDSLSSVIMVAVFVPLWGINGYILMVMLSETLNFTLSIRRLSQVTDFDLTLFDGLIKPVLCVFAAMPAAQGLFHLCPFDLSPLWSLLFQVALLLPCYGVFLCITGCLTKEDRQWLWSLFTRA